MAKKKNLTAKVVAGLALGAIILSIIGTGILFVAGSFQSRNTEISEQELEELLRELPDGEVIQDDAALPSTENPDTE